MKEVKKMQEREKIEIPYNEDTKHIYDTFATVARSIMARRKAQGIETGLEHGNTALQRH